jgi:hypothetical protein
MNVTQLGQNIEAPAVNSIAEAVRGLARDRSLLVKELKDANRSWMHFDSFAKEQAARIDATDRRIDALLVISTTEISHSASFKINKTEGEK